MLIYLVAIAIVFICLLIFYKKGKKLRKIESVSSANYGLSVIEHQSFIAAAERCKKNNSPVSDDPFHELYLIGSEIVNRESFLIINNEVEKGSDLRAL